MSTEEWLTKIKRFAWAFLNMGREADAARQRGESAELLERLDKETRFLSWQLSGVCEDDLELRKLAIAAVDAERNLTAYARDTARNC